MKRSRRLSSTQNVNARRKHRIKARRQSESRPDDQRKKHEDHHQVCHPLDHVVRKCLGLIRSLKPYVFGEHYPERLPCPVGRGRKQIASKVPGPQTPDGIEEANEHHSPSSLKVKIAAPTILIGQHVAITRLHQRSRGRDRYLEQRPRPHVSGFAPIKTRVRDHDLNPAYQQSKEADRSNPVRDTNKRSMSGRIRILEWINVGHVGKDSTAAKSGISG